MRKACLYVLIVVIHCLIISGCDSTNRDWEKAQKSKTVEIYQGFIAKHPESKLVPAAKIEIDKLLWQKAQQANTVEAYQEFIKKYPSSKFISEAKAGIDTLNWQKAQQVNTVDAYREFVEKYPKSPFVGEANIKITLIRGMKLLSLKDPEDKIEGAVLIRVVGDKAMQAVPLIIDLIGDSTGIWVSDPTVAVPSSPFFTATYSVKTSIGAEAIKCLKIITGQDFGDNKAKWRAWWEKNKEKK